VLFTIERFHAVYFPLKRCSWLYNKRFIFCMIFFTLTFHSFALLTSGVEPVHQNGIISCVTLLKWFNYMNIFALIDMILTIFIPFLFVFVLNLLIIHKLNQTKFEYTVNRHGSRNLSFTKSQEEKERKRSSKLIRSAESSRQNTLTPNGNNITSSLLINMN